MEDSLYIGVDHCIPEEISGCTQELKYPQKFWTKISCPANSFKRLHLGVGDMIQVGCIQRLWKKVWPERITRLRYDVCSNSLEGHNREGQFVCHLIGEQEISIPSSVEFISYRPWLHMVITNVSSTKEGQSTFEAEEL